MKTIEERLQENLINACYEANVKFGKICQELKADPDGAEKMRKALVLLNNFGLGAA